MKPTCTPAALAALPHLARRHTSSCTHIHFFNHAKTVIRFGCFCCILLLLQLATVAQVKTFTVNVTSDESDGNAGTFGDDGVCDVDPLIPGNQCTFRAAIQNHNGNRHLGQNEIKFNIANAPGSGSIVIKVGASGSLGALPNVLGSVIIKAKNEPDQRRIEIDGSQAGAGAAGLSLLGGNSQISFLIINSFSSHGIFISGTPPPGGGGHIITANYIGTDSSGKVDKGNGGDGIYIDNTPGERIGGDKLEEMNIISANKGYGIVIHGADPLVDFQPNGARNIVIAGNFIGLDASGNLLLPNLQGGVLNNNAPDNRIGADSPGRGNKVAGVRNGITVRGNLSEGVSILGNFIGKDGTGLKFTAGIFTRSGRALSVKANFLENIDSVGMDIYLDANGSYDILHNKVNGTVKIGTKFTFGPGRVIDINYNNNLHRTNSTGLVIDESVNSTINWLVTGDTAINGGTGGNVIFRAAGKKHFETNRWEANAGLGLKYAFDLAAGVNATFILDGNVSVRNGLGGFEGDVKLSAQSAFTHSMFNLVGSENGKDGYKLALKATAGATSTVTFSGESDFSLNGGFGVAITGDKVVLDIARFSFEKSSARRNVDGAFYLFDVKFGFSITGNEITGNQGPAITLDGEAFAHIDSNNISGNGPAILIKQLATASINDNAITDNTKGIVISGVSTGTLISNNSIFNNSGPGIDLGDDGITPNHPGGRIPGPNFFQNYPVLTAVNSSGGNTAINGSLNSAANTTYKVEFFSNSSCDPSGFGEGQRFLGSIMVTTDASGNADFSTLLTGITVTNGFAITSTATDPGNNTSEFSKCIISGGPVLAADLAVTKTADNTAATVGQQVTFLIVVVNRGPGIATQIVVIETMPGGIVVNQATPSTGNFESVGGVWTIPSLNAGAQASLLIVTTVTASGRYSNVAGIIAANEPDPVPENNQALVNIVVTEVTIQSMIQNLMAKVTAFEQQGFMRIFPAADLTLTLKRALRYVNELNASEAIRQLQLFISIVHRMVETGYISADYARLLTDDATEIITRLQRMHPFLTENIERTNGTNQLNEWQTDPGNVRTSMINFQAYPNPFMHVVRINFGVASAGPVEVKVSDINGRIVEWLINKTLLPGNYQIEWRPKNVAPGFYLLHLNQSNTIVTRRLIYMK
jgi:uncharacterized repeat protein (TIGR01451 family)